MEPDNSQSNAMLSINCEVLTSKQVGVNGSNLGGKNTHSTSSLNVEKSLYFILIFI